jgi:hypothetical protein
VSCVEGVRERVEKLAAEDLRERLNREEEAAARVNPVTIGMKRTGGHQAVQMQVLAQCLTPGVQDEGGGDLAAEPARVGAELDKGCRDTCEEQAIYGVGITLGERVQLMRQREHEMAVRHRQELGAPGGKPALLGERLALGAMPVAAGVVGVALRAAGLALRDVTAKGFGAASGDGAHRPMLHRYETVHSTIRRTVTREDVCELESAAGRIRAPRMAVHYGRSSASTRSL